MNYSPDWKSWWATADAASRHGRHPQAAAAYAEAGARLRPAVSSARPLAADHLPLAQQYYGLCRLEVNELLAAGADEPARQLLLKTLRGLRQHVSNLVSPLACRAAMLTCYKQFFYVLSGFYLTRDQPEKLRAYVQQQSSDLARWGQDLRLTRQFESPH